MLFAPLGLSLNLSIRGLIYYTATATTSHSQRPVDFSFSEKDPETGDWVVASGRYTVRLDGPEGRLVKVRAANVEEEDDDWAGGAGRDGGGSGKKKGAPAGKKGRRGRK